MNKRQKIIYSIFLVTILLLVLFQIPYFKTPINNSIFSIKDYFQNNNIIAQAIREQLFPQNLISSSSQQPNVLNRTEVINLTNKERQKQGLPILVENAKLDSGALQKLNDLFTRQYFDHVSPDGHGPSWIAEQSGYAYVTVGENLALGDFKDNAALVAAWMASPGHKANILNTRFVDIGVAVARKKYQGRLVWIAVQEFGKPLSDCPTIDTNLRIKVETDRSSVELLNKDLATKKQELSTLSQTSSNDQALYNQKVAAYNTEVAAYNNLAGALKAEIQIYNMQVQAFNSCIKQ